ncbi:MAG: hypothetical protein P3A28_00935 [Gemmatimonadota bacterium]|nr:hypothetical protein [Gemmatimonadota bacterium]
MFTQLLSQPPIALNKAKPTLAYGNSVEAVVMRGLAKDPKARYASVLEFASALAAALSTDAKPAADDSGIFSRMKGMFKGKS